ncbi:MAG: helicase-exonuclease AddAB subunit AddA [Calditrichia bacterium]
MQLTKSQKESLAYDKNIMVLAGAGTGKTRALSERVITILRETGVVPSRLLILTFTRKAASEMKDRIYNRLLDLAVANPGDNHLQLCIRQFNEMPVTTFHGFFSSLLREFGYRINIPHQYSVLEDEAILHQIRRKSVDMQLRSWAAGKQENLTKFFFHYDLRTITEASLEMLAETQSIKQFLRFFKEQIGEISLQNTEAFFRQLFNFHIPQLLDDLREPLQQLNNECTAVYADKKKPGKALSSLNKIFESYFSDHIISVKQIPQLWKSLKENGFLAKSKTGSTIQGGLKSTNLSDLSRAVDDVNAVLLRHSERIHMPVQWISELIGASENGNPDQQYVNVIYLWLLWMDDLLIQYSNLKRTSNYLEFSDLEEYTFQLLTQFPDLAEMLKSRYRYIMIDEFQDTNRLQWDIISTFISEENDLGRDKLFVVGDKKQAIYGFRGGVVELCDVVEGMVSRQNNKESKNEQSGIIHFRDNFRSDGTLLEFFNKLGNWIFPDSTRRHIPAFDTEYVPLIAGNQQADADKHNVFFAVYPGYVDLSDEKNSGENKVKSLTVGERQQIEARFIAWFLRCVYSGDWKSLSNGMPEYISEKNLCKQFDWLHQSMQEGKKSVGVLARNTAGLAIYENELIKAGIPFKIESGQSLFRAPEIEDLINCLNFLTDPGNEASLIGWARGLLWGLSDLFINFLSAVKTENAYGIWDKMEHLYRSLKSSEESIPDSALFGLEELLGDRLNDFMENTIYPDLQEDVKQLTFYKNDWILFFYMMPIIEQLRKEMTILVPVHFLQSVIKKLQIFETLELFDDKEQKKANIYSFIELMNEYFISNPQQNLSDFLMHIDSLAAGGSMGQGEPDEEAVVQILTVHKSKGLEFPFIILIDADRDPLQGISKSGRHSFLCDDLPLDQHNMDDNGLHFPDVNTKYSDPLFNTFRLPYFIPMAKPRSDLERKNLLTEYLIKRNSSRNYAEERRLLYVALTRAERGCLVLLNHKAKPIIAESGEDIVSTPMSWNDILMSMFDCDSLSDHDGPYALKQEFNMDNISVLNLDPQLFTENQFPERTKVTKTDSIITKEIHIPLFEEKTIISPSQITEYEEDHVPEKPVFTMDPTEFGTILHLIMEKGWWKYKKDQLSAILKNQYPLMAMEDRSELIRHAGNASMLITPYLDDHTQIHAEIPFFLADQLPNDAAWKGVIDLVVIKDNQALIFDYKTNLVDHPDRHYAEKHGYHYQLAVYCRAVTEIMNVEVKEAGLIFTHSGNHVLYSKEELKGIYQELVTDIGNKKIFFNKKRAEDLR